MANAATWLISRPPKPLEVPLSTRSEKAENYLSRISLQLELSMWPGPRQADVLRQDSRGESEGWGAGSSRETCSWGKGIGSTGAAVPEDGGVRDSWGSARTVSSVGDYSSLLSMSLSLPGIQEAF